MPSTEGLLSKSGNGQTDELVSATNKADEAVMAASSQNNGQEPGLVQNIMSYSGNQVDIKKIQKEINSSQNERDAVNVTQQNNAEGISKKVNPQTIRLNQYSDIDVINKAKILDAASQDYTEDPKAPNIQVKNEKKESKVFTEVHKFYK